MAYPVPRATRRKKGLPGAWAVLFQRAVGSDPAGCASRRAHRVETAIAFRLHNALGTQNERYFVAVNPTAHSLACLRIGVFVAADAARLATGVGGSPFTGRVSHPLDGKQSFMTYSSIPLDRPAWPHHATTPRRWSTSPIQYANNRAEVSHQPTRQRERQMRRFTSAAQLQRFASVHGIVQHLFRVSRHLLRSAHHRLLRTRAFVEWDAVTCAC